MSEKIAIIGLGATGLSCVNFFKKKGINVTVFDTRELPPGKEQLDEQTALVCGPLSATTLSEFDTLVVSPGIAIATPEITQAADNGCEVIGDIELFARELQHSAYDKAKLITITGSNGKSTVTSLVGFIAEQAAVKVAVGGNIGIPALDLLNPDVELYILELSSFQLETTESLSADIATILNISEDHLDRYANYQAYIDAKHKIYQQSQSVLVNQDDPLTFTNKQPQQSFALADAQFAIQTVQDKSYLAVEGEPWLACSKLKLSGKHNWLNALAATALSLKVGINKQAILTGLENYQGLSHRCEFVKELNGVRWINDSKATNIGATQAALAGLSDTIAGKVHVILGGDGKGADFAELKPVLTEVQGEILCFGQDAKQIAEQHVRAQRVDNLQQAVTHINQHVSDGDLVILSPACASIDMYKNFMQRGEHFTQLVNELNEVG